MRADDAAAVARRLASRTLDGARTAGRRAARPMREVRVSISGQGEVRGLHHVSPEGPAIVAASHHSLVDAWTLRAHLPRPVTALDVHELTEAVRHRRAGGAERRDAWRRAMDAVEAGGLVAVFPQGDPTADGAVHKGYDSVGWLVLAVQRVASVPVVPAALEAHGAALVLGEALDFSRFSDVAGERTIARAITDEITQAVADLGGWRYDDVHARTAHARSRGLRRQRRRQRRMELLGWRDAQARQRERRLSEAQVERADLARRAASAVDEARAAALRAAERDRALRLDDRHRP